MEFAHLICDEASAAMQEHRFFAADEEDWARARWKAQLFYGISATTNH